jgi:hypothetical protein
MSCGAGVFSSSFFRSCIVAVCMYQKFVKFLSKIVCHE